MHRLKFVRLQIVAIAIVGLGIIACHPEEKKGSGSLTIQWKLVYGNVPLEMFSQYAYPVTKDPLYFSRLSFFLSDLTATSGAGDFVLKEVDYLDLTAAHTAPVKVNGLEYSISNVPEGEYTGLTFGIGVPAAKNALRPIDYPAGSILSNSAEYWSSWKSYIFFRPEGRISLNGQPIDEADFALHLGADGTYRIISLAKPFIVSKNKETVVVITLDMERFFNSVHLHDMEANRQIHSLSQLPVMRNLADNLATAFK